MGVAGALALTGCADASSGGGGGGGEGLEWGATKAEFQAAFADVSPMTLNTQSTAPKGSITGRNLEQYFDSITEWSDGKIKFDVVYSNAIAPPAEVDDALNDGRLDLGQVLPIYEPKEYPKNAAFVESTFMSDQSVVTGALQSNAWPLEVAYQTPELVQEFADHGMQLLMPQYNSGPNALLCSKPRNSLDTLKGAQSASGGQAQTAQLKALGVTAVSVPYTEQFESLERGVVDCSVSSLTVAALGGFIPAAPQVVIDPEAGFALAPGSMAMSMSVWETLPLIAQQLFYDRLDVFLKGNIEKIWDNTVEAGSQVAAAGGSFGIFSDDARAKMDETNAALLQELAKNTALSDGPKFVSDVQASTQKWSDIVAELGYANEVDFNGFPTWYTPGKIDLDPYVNKVYEEIFLPQRPS